MSLLRELLSACFEAGGRRKDRATKDDPLWISVEAVRSQLAELPLIRERSLLVRASVGRGNAADIPWIAILDPRVSNTTQRGLYVVYLFRADMTGIYLSLNQGATEAKKAAEGSPSAWLAGRAREIREWAPVKELLGAGRFQRESMELKGHGNMARLYERGSVAEVLYARGELPGDDELTADLERVLRAYEHVVPGYISRFRREAAIPGEIERGSLRERLEPGEEFREHRFDWPEEARQLAAALEREGFLFQPWQLAAYLAALRTKPFVILAGVSGTGKSKLPQLVAERTGGEARLIPVRPDWTDSSELLGYLDLSGNFRAGRLLDLARRAAADPEHHYVAILDEMNLARVEHYLAEVLSRMEERRPAPGGGYASGPLLGEELELEGEAARWKEVGLPPNLALVGTVNMDESTLSISRKVLDRAFTLEFSEVELARWRAQGEEAAAPEAPEIEPWPTSAWRPRAARLSELRGLDDGEVEAVERAVRALEEANRFLRRAQLQVAYRVRDEVALFVLHAREIAELFRDRAGEPVDPLDLALEMKILPRIAGGSNTVRWLLQRLLLWAVRGLEAAEHADEQAADELLARWNHGEEARPWESALFPRTAERLCMMLDRLQSEAYTSFWL